MLAVIARQRRKHVQHPASIRPAIRAIPPRQSYNQLITYRRADKPHARPRRQTSVGSKLCEVTGRSRAAFQPMQCACIRSRPLNASSDTASHLNSPMNKRRVVIITNPPLPLRSLNKGSTKLGGMRYYEYQAYVTWIGRSMSARDGITRANESTR